MNADLKIFERRASRWVAPVKFIPLISNAEIAKTGVEQAIETDEATATTWINEQSERLGVKLT